MKFLLGFHFLLLIHNLQVTFAQAPFESVKDTYFPRLQLEKTDSALHFIALGDWGKNGGDFQKPVAYQMAKVAEELPLDFIISTGDNFYPSGVENMVDPLFKTSFEDIYNYPSLQVKWFPVLGNHDYLSNPDAQVGYSAHSTRWSMNGRYYSNVFNIQGDTTQKVLFLFIDTNPLVPRYHKKHHYGKEIKSQKPEVQKEWIKKNLEDLPANIKWKIIVGHHPIYTGGQRRWAYDTRAVRSRLKPIIKRYQVDAYVSGHEHNLQHLKISKKAHQFISGAGSEFLPLKNIPKSKMAIAASGFLVFSVKSNQLLMQAISKEGEVLYKCWINKR
ncbi:metallophosphoesterase [Desertivirga arenae]|uniref:metallophosphoesterase n=1 Tax=Desertivirga arenae TaxID=2810309 RepID=UPI001A96178D|nr:metallophosphoesterase [Pedobacter sp. SYSU D00823]